MFTIVIYFSPFELFVITKCKSQLYVSLFY